MFFGKLIGAPICARFGKPIGSSKSTAQQTSDVAKAIAKNCSSFGEPKPLNPDWNMATFQVALPDPDVLKFNPKTQQESVRSCNTCAHFVREDVVLREMGYSTALCSAKGKLLLPGRYVYESRDCEYRSLALQGVRTDVNNIMMLPEYSADFTLSTDPVKYHHQMMQNFVDPTLYESDKIVSDEDHAAGIRAWRAVEDPNTGNQTWLPIYRRDFFTEAEQAKIPATGDDEHPEDYIDHGFYVYKVAVLWRELDETPGMWGEAGTGKTEFYRHMAWLMQLPFERFSITGSSEIDDLAGKMHYSPDKGTYWQDGRLVSAWSKPCVLVVDEPNAGPPDVWQFLRPMTDNSKQLVLDMSDEATPRKRHDDCYLGLAMNPAWDPKNVGTHQIGDADANRLMHIYVPMPPEKLEREIITKRCAHDGYEIDPALLNTIMNIASDIRANITDGRLQITWAVRPQLKVARASNWFDIRTCYAMAIGDFLEQEQKDQVMDIVETHVE
jgi:MoxR-like ATPase